MTITLSKTVSEKLEEYSEELREDKTKIIVDALECYFDYLDVRVAENVLKSYEMG